MSETTATVKSNKIHIGQLAVLAITALATMPKKGTDEELFRDWALGMLVEEPDETTLSELLERKLIKEIDNEPGYMPTQFGMKLVLNGCSPTPNFSRLAESDFGIALKMLFTAFEALRKRVAETETKQIMPKRLEDGSWGDTQLVTNLHALKAWIEDVTKEYTASLETQPATKAAAKAAKSK